MKYLVWFLVAFVFSGCFKSDFIPLELGAKRNYKVYSFIMPKNSNSEWTTGYYIHDPFSAFYRRIKNLKMSEQISFIEKVEDKKTIDKYFKMEKTKISPKEYFKASFPDNKEASIDEMISWTHHGLLSDNIDYIGNIKCQTTREIYKATTKIFYTTKCPYYVKDNANIIKYLVIKYEVSLFDKDKSMQALKIFKQTKKELFDSIIIHDIDTARMEKEGLMHYDKKYDPNAEYNPLMQWLHPAYEYKLKIND
ncbi:hypothetical protein [Campylobacter mucosalis]|uniref:hypothetical protein n=1 Tax=Campylobacter mucosalis TaxID=202 RepID=UPI00146FE258|nr:hypothetical protein [Campylobacter mucosalis]